MSDVSEVVQSFIDRQPGLNRRRRLMMPFIQFILNLFCRTQVNGLQNIPSSGRTILIANHLSFFDPGIATAVVKHRYVISMAKHESINNLLVRLVIALWGNYYVKRGTVDRQALLNTIELIKHEQLVWLAPEGTRHREGLQEPKDGIAYIAAKANATIVPMSIIGISDLGHNVARLRRTPVEVNFGAPFRFNADENTRLTRPMRSQMTQEAMYQIACTIPENHAHLRGAYANLESATTDTLIFLDLPVPDGETHARSVY